MQIQRVDASRGLGWFGAGWGLFKADIGMWVVLTILSGLVVLLTHLIPVVGPLLFALLLPGLLAGLLHAAREASEKRPLDIGHLYAGFKDERLRNPLLVLGAFLLAAHIVMTLVALLLVGGSMGLMGLAGGGEQEALAAGAGIGILLALLIITAIACVLALAFFYAVPLVLFAAAKPVEAMKSSIAACLANFLPLLVFGVFYLVLALLAALPLMLGYLVLVPVTIGAIYTSYREIYASADEAGDMAL